MIGLSVEAVRNIEYSKYTPTAKTIDSICKTFNLLPADLLTDIPSEDEKSMIAVINSKLKGCNEKELSSIITMIDVIRSTYRHL